MTWHVSPYWLDTWHNINVTRGMNNFQKKELKKFKKKFKKIQKNSKIQKNEKLTRGISLTPLTLY